MEQPFFFSLMDAFFFFSSFISTNTLVRSLHFEFFLFARRFAFFFSSGYGDRVPTVPLGGRIVSDHGQVRGAPIMRENTAVSNNFHATSHKCFRSPLMNTVARTMSMQHIHCC